MIQGNSGTQQAGKNGNKEGDMAQPQASPKGLERAIKEEEYPKEVGTPKLNVGLVGSWGTGLLNAQE